MKKKIVFLPYDMDTALGINNEGSLTFDYWLEDVDQVNGADVFNGQQSVLWNNLRDAFGDEIKAMYQTLRANGILSYANVENRFETHQSKWPETIFNEDAKYKYIDPLIEDGNSSYLGMLLGSKTEQRKWWLNNRFIYMDSKWNAGDALSDIITIRGYAKANITLTPYADIYPSIKFGSYLVQQRGQRGQSYTIVCPLDNLDDTEIYIYSSSQLADIGDISGLMPGYCDFSNAVRLQHLVIGSGASGYSNPKLEHLTVGNLPLLLDIDVRNCPNLAETVDLSGCVNLETIRFGGTAITGVQLANGGAVETLQLPASITNLTLRNLKQLSSLSVAGYSNITTLWLEGNSSAVNTRTIFDAISTGARVRILDIQWSVTSNTASFISKLEGMRGIDESGNNTQYAQLSGSIYFSTISGTQLATLREHYPNVTFSYGTLQYSVDMYSEDGTTLLKSNSVTAGANCPSYTPTKASTAQYTYTFAGWATSVGGQVVSNALNNIQSDKKLYAVFNATLRKYTVRFYNESTLLQTVQNVSYGGTATYTGSEPTKEGYEFAGWSPSNTNITGDTSCYAQFELATLDVTEITDSWATIVANCNNGTAATKYNVGNYKYLDLGTEGNIRMQIVAKNKDVLADNTGNASLTWVAMETLTTAKRWNVALGEEYRFDQAASFKRNSTSSTNTGYNQWNAQNMYYANNTAKITITATAVADGTLRLKYVTGASSSNSSSLKVNGTEVVSSHSTSAQDYDLAITNGTTYTIVYETTRLDNTNTTSIYLKLCNTSNSGKKADVDALVTYTTSIDNCYVRVVDHYTPNTGGLGGWENCELRTYLRGTIFNAMPSELQSGIKEVTKGQQSYVNTSGTSVNAVAQTSTETVWLPSYYEVFGSAITGETSSMPKYTTVFRDSSSRIKYKYNTSTAQNWWLRSAFNSTTAGGVYSNGNDNYNTTTNGYAVVPGFCT